MNSELVPGVVYTDTDRDITEHDLDIISDLWSMDGREVYRGSRDPRYTHANVYWLYSETLERAGLTEHSLTDQADFRVLWFRETEFGTILQEDGWEQGDDIWSCLPRPVVDRFIHEGWTTPVPFLTQCLNGPMRVLTAEMIRTWPQVHTCTACGRRSLTPPPGCTTQTAPLTIPTTEKLLFIDSDMIVYRPPPSSRVWDLIQAQPPSSGDSPRPEAAEPLEASEPSTPPAEAETPPRRPESPPQ